MAKSTSRKPELNDERLRFKDRASLPLMAGKAKPDGDIKHPSSPSGSFFNGSEVSE
jgi:hypothetical protein